MFCCVLLCVHFSFTIILIGKREHIEDSDQPILYVESSIGALWLAKGPSFLQKKTKTLIRLCGCAG